jgi:hypothetical protein
VIASAIGCMVEVVGSAGNVCSPGDVEPQAACMSAVIAYPERIAALGNQACERALSTFGHTRMLEVHGLIGEHRQRAEFQIWLEANEFSKNSRVATAL